MTSIHEQIMGPQTFFYDVRWCKLVCKTQWAAHPLAPYSFQADCAFDPGPFQSSSPGADHYVRMSPGDFVSPARWCCGQSGVWDIRDVPEDLGWTRATVLAGDGTVDSGWLPLNHVRHSWANCSSATYWSLELGRPVNVDGFNVAHHVSLAYTRPLPWESIALAKFCRDYALPHYDGRTHWVHSSITGERYRSGLARYRSRALSIRTRDCCNAFNTMMSGRVAGQFEPPLKRLDAIFDTPLFRKGGWLIGTLQPHSDVYLLADALQNFVRYEVLDNEVVEQVPLHVVEVWPRPHITLAKPNGELHTY